MENRVLIHAPYGRDADVIRQVLEARDLRVCVCAAASELMIELERESATTIMTEECLSGGLHSAIGTYLETQGVWSDYPFVVLATRQREARSQKALAALRELGNLVLLERPVNADTLASAVQSAVRARRRQYLNRGQLAELTHSKREVEKLNADLEQRIEARTHDLSAANNRLMEEIAERERAQNSVVQGQKMEAIGQLTGGMAHDFNNVLHVVNLNLELIHRLSPDERLRGFALRAKDAATRGSRLAGQLLAFARSQSLTPKLHDANKLVANMSELLAVSLGSRVRLMLELCTQPALVMVDASQLEMALLNLAVNSRDAMPQGGELVIRSEREARGSAPWVRISVRDTGTGISPSLMSKIFDPFFTTKPVGGGTGLGLSQVYGFVKQSGGTVDVDSELGQGTTVVLRFPLAAEREPAEDARAQPAPPANDVFEVLVVEDDPAVRRTVVECLHVLGYRVREAVDGNEGVDLLRRRRPDLLLVDYLMPGINGVDVILEARKLYPGLPTLLATGFADMSRVEGVVGRQAVLAKPFDIDTLGKVVAKELRRDGEARQEILAGT